MSQYITEDFYYDIFEGTKIPDDVINKYLKLASEKIDSITFNRIVKIGFDNLTAFQKEKIQYAVCYQAEYTYENGTEISDIASYNVLDISVSVKEKRSEASVIAMSDEAFDLVRKTGLTNRSFRFNYGKEY